MRASIFVGLCVQVSRVAQRGGSSAPECYFCDLFSNHSQGYKYIGQFETLETKTFPLFLACNFPFSTSAVLILAEVTG